VTGQVLVAAAGHSFPVSPAAREAKPAPPPASTPLDSQAGSSLPVPVLPPATGTGSAGVPLEPLGGAAGSVPPSTGTSPPAKPPAAKSGGSLAVPPAAVPEGDEAEAVPTAPSAPAFEAGESSGPEPWAPIGIGLGASAVALGSVLILGRRFSW
jgi:hypothetical protein